jgi:hypothetical protein
MMAMSRMAANGEIEPDYPIGSDRQVLSDPLLGRNVAA